jgi:hypothetical protein
MDGVVEVLLMVFTGVVLGCADSNSCNGNYDQQQAAVMYASD